LRFLERIEDLCTEKQIKLIIVNMPLSKENKKLFSDGFYDSYRADVAKTVRSPAVFIDLAASENWPMSCYHDSVHLNEKGGARLNKVIANAIAQDAWQAHSDTTQSQ
jgi:RNase H-fold protein (predicted Holliday junction resolvase)